MGSCHPEKNQCRLRRSRCWHWFSRGDYFPCFPLVHSLFIILYWMFLKTSSTLRLVSKPSRSGEYLSLYLYYVNSNAHTTQVRIYGEPYHNFCAFDFSFGISPVVKQYHPLPSLITCNGVVSWYSGWYWLLTYVVFDRNCKSSVWWHISADTCHIIMSTCQIFMMTYQIFMLTCQIFLLTCHLFIS